MTKRPWIPIAVVLLVLLGATVLVGSLIRSRLSDAEVVLEPFMEPSVVSDGTDLLAESCEAGTEIARHVQDFYAAIERGDDEISTTGPTFDSFLLESAIARVVAGDHQLFLQARSSNGAWCIDFAEFTTDE